jgi:hypothetical protein
MARRARPASEERTPELGDTERSRGCLEQRTEGVTQRRPSKLHRATRSAVVIVWERVPRAAAEARGLERVAEPREPSRQLDSLFDQGGDLPVHLIEIFGQPVAQRECLLSQGTRDAGVPTPAQQETSELGLDQAVCTHGPEHGRGV